MQTWKKHKALSWILAVATNENDDVKHPCTPPTQSFLYTRSQTCIHYRHSFCKNQSHKPHHRLNQSITMLRTYISRRTFTQAARLAEEKTFAQQAAEAAKKVAGAFKAEGSVGKECASAQYPLLSLLPSSACTYRASELT